MGVPLVEEQHEDDDGVVHFACELGGVHIAFYQATDDGAAPAPRTSGSCFAGLAVKSVSDVVQRAAAAGVTVLEPPTSYPWGVRALVRDPDGRSLEVFEPATD